MTSYVSFLPPTAEQMKTRGGLYIVRHKCDELFTLGKYDRQTLAERIGKHRVVYQRPFSNKRHEFHPFEDVVFWVNLAGWPSLAIDLAESALHGLVGQKHAFCAKSVFRAERDTNFHDVGSKLEHQLVNILSAQSASN